MSQGSFREISFILFIVTSQTRSEKVSREKYKEGKFFSQKLNELIP